MNSKKIISIIVYCLSCGIVYGQPAMTIKYTGGVDATLLNTTVGSQIVFGNLEVNLSKIIEIEIENSGSSPGSLNITKIEMLTGMGGTSTNDYSQHWSVLEPPSTSPSVLPINTTYNLNAGDKKKLRVRFNPTNSASLGGDLEMTLRITTNLSTPNFALRGVATKSPINYVLTLDKSGSMLDFWGAPDRKIDKLRAAADFFVGLASLRPNDPSQPFAGDKLGLVKYSTFAETPPAYLQLGEISTVLSNAHTKLLPSATALGGELYPNGWTNTGDAVVQSMAQLTVGEKNILIVFSDGMENQPPITNSVGYISSVLAPRAADVDIYTIGMGNDVNPATLRDLSTNSGFAVPRYFFLPDNFSGGASSVNAGVNGFAPSATYALNSIYLKIYAEAAGYAIPNDPERTVCLCDGDQIIFDTWVTTSDNHAIFTLFHESDSQERTYDLQLLNPKGNVITAGAMIGGLSSKIISNPNYTIYKVEFNGAASDQFSGQWKVRFSPKIKTTNRASVTIGYGALAFSNLSMETDAIAPNYSPGSPIIVGINFKESGLSVQNIKGISVNILTPSGKQFSLIPQKDIYGMWTVSFPNTFDVGAYTIFTKATLYNSKGEFTTRESTRYVSLGKDFQLQPDKPSCPSCSLVCISLIVGSLVFLITLVFLLKKWWFRIKLKDEK